MGRFAFTVTCANNREVVDYRPTHRTNNSEASRLSFYLYDGGHSEFSGDRQQVSLQCFSLLQLAATEADPNRARPTRRRL